MKGHVLVVLGQRIKLALSVDNQLRECWGTESTFCWPLVIQEKKGVRCRNMLSVPGEETKKSPKKMGIGKQAGRWYLVCEQTLQDFGEKEKSPGVINMPKQDKLWHGVHNPVKSIHLNHATWRTREVTWRVTNADRTYGLPLATHQLEDEL